MFRRFFAQLAIIAGFLSVISLHANSWELVEGNALQAAAEKLSGKKYELDDDTTSFFTRSVLGFSGFTIGDICSTDRGLYASAYTNRTRSVLDELGYEHKVMDILITPLPDGRLEMRVVRFFWPKKLFFREGIDSRHWYGTWRELITDPFHADDTTITFRVRKYSLVTGRKVETFVTDMCQVHLMRHRNILNGDPVQRKVVSAISTTP